MNDQRTTIQHAMNNSNLSRRNFFKASALAGMGATIARVSLGAEPVAPSSGELSATDISLTRPRPSGQKPVNTLTTKPLEKVRVAVIGLHRGLTHVGACSGIEFAEVVAVCDVVDDRAKAAADLCEKDRQAADHLQQRREHVWEQMGGTR